MDGVAVGLGHRCTPSRYSQHTFTALARELRAVPACVLMDPTCACASLSVFLLPDGSRGGIHAAACDDAKQPVFQLASAAVQEALGCHDGHIPLEWVPGSMKCDHVPSMLLEALAAVDDGRNLERYHFDIVTVTEGAMNGHRALGVGTNQVKRRRACLVALAIALARAGAALKYGASGSLAQLLRLADVVPVATRDTSQCEPAPAHVSARRSSRVASDCSTPDGARTVRAQGHPSGPPSPLPRDGGPEKAMVMESMRHHVSALRRSLAQTQGRERGVRESTSRPPAKSFNRMPPPDGVYNRQRQSDGRW